jgi:hypothetical protein
MVSMANEARVLAGSVDKTIVRTVTVADATAIPKGTLLVFAGSSNVAVAHAAALNQRAAGFATSSKLASDGYLTMGVQRTGEVIATADGVITSGDLVRISRTTANRVERLATVQTGLSYQDYEEIIGRALTSCVDAGTVRVALTIG